MMTLNYSRSETLPRLHTQKSLSKSKEKQQDRFVENKQEFKIELRSDQRSQQQIIKSPPENVKRIDRILTNQKKCYIKDKKTQQQKELDVHSLNQKLNNLYFPTDEYSWRQIQIEQEREKERNRNNKRLIEVVPKKDINLNKIKQRQQEKRLEEYWTQIQVKLKSSTTSLKNIITSSQSHRQFRTLSNKKCNN